MRSNFRGTFLSEYLHGRFVEYLRAGRRKVPPAIHLSELICTFSAGAKCDRRALQGKFKSWAKRMWLSGDDTLMLGSKVIVSRERFADIAWSFHTASPEHHLSVSEVALKVQSVYTWGQKDFGMIWEVISFTCAICPKPECQRDQATVASSSGTKGRGGHSNDLAKCPPPWLLKSVSGLKESIATGATPHLGTTDVERGLLESAMKSLRQHLKVVMETERAVKCPEATSAQNSEKSEPLSTEKVLGASSAAAQDTTEPSTSSTSADENAAKLEPSEGTWSRLLLPHLCDPESSDQLIEILCILGSDDIADDGSSGSETWEDGNQAASACGTQEDFETPAKKARTSDGGCAVQKKDLYENPQCFSKLAQDIDQLRMFFPLRGKPSLARCDYLRSRIESLLKEVSRLRDQLEPLK